MKNKTPGSRQISFCFLFGLLIIRNARRKNKNPFENNFYPGVSIFIR
jgi:hypothetical protein